MIRWGIKRIILSLLALLLLACTSKEPNASVSEKLVALSPAEAEYLLLKEVSALNKWILKQRHKYDSTHSYIFENILTKDLYKNSYKHFSYTKKLIVSNEVNAEVKNLLVRFSQCLDLKDYLSLGQLIIDFGDVELMTVFISPGPEYGTLLTDNYDDDEVRVFLNAVLEKYPSIKESIEFIVSGSHSRQINEHRKFGEQFGESYPVIQCLSR